jgi:chromosome segregation ATPase
MTSAPSAANKTEMRNIFTRPKSDRNANPDYLRIVEVLVKDKNFLKDQLKEERENVKKEQAKIKQLHEDAERDKKAYADLQTSHTFLQTTINHTRDDAERDKKACADLQASIETLKTNYDNLLDLRQQLFDSTLQAEKARFQLDKTLLQDTLEKERQHDTGTARLELS